MSFEQAAIKVEKEAEFAELKAAITRAFDPKSVERYLKKLRSKRLRVRDFDGVLAKGTLDEGKEKRSLRLYRALTLSDQAQMREFYLFKLEEVSPELRTKFSKLYQYY
jgi:hypothetical protein